MKVAHGCSADILVTQDELDFSRIKPLLIPQEYCQVVSPVVTAEFHVEIKQCCGVDQLRQFTCRFLSVMSGTRGKMKLPHAGKILRYHRDIVRITNRKCGSMFGQRHKDFALSLPKFFDSVDKK